MFGLPGKSRKGIKQSLLLPLLTGIVFASGLALDGSRQVYALPIYKVDAIPAFARKYGLECSACHTAWPELNSFGIAFRDRGYQLGNDRDAPIYQNLSYFPITFRITPNWHRENTDHQPIDAVPGDASSGLVNGSVTQSGFDLSGLDIWAAGTLSKNISFSVLPSSDSNANFHFENAYVRFDSLMNTGWLNVKIGKFELDNLISEKRFLFLSNNGGLYQSYHFVPPGDLNNFGLGDNQLGVELSGHSENSYTRYGVALLSSTEGATGLGTNKSYDTYFTFSQAFQTGSLGLQRLGVYAYLGQRATCFQTSGGTAITGTGEKPFYRLGFTGDLSLGKFEFLPFFMHGHDNSFLGTSTPSNLPLSVGAAGPTWNSGFIETHYHWNPQLVFTQRYELVRMDRQALPTTPAKQGNIDAYSFGARWYPVMISRAGLALHSEYSIVGTVGRPALSGDGAGAAPLSPTEKVWSSSLLLGFDFAF
jgi:hypothetical protein